MKVTQQNLIALLQRLGVQDVDVVEEQEEGFELDTLIDQLKMPNAEFIENELRKSIAKDLESANYAEFMGKLRSAISKQSGVLKRSELEGLGLIELVDKIVQSSKGESKQSEEQWLEKLSALNSEHEAELNSKIEHYENLIRQKDYNIARKGMLNRVQSILEKIPRVGGNLGVQAEMALTQLERLYNVKFDENKGSIGLYSKEDGESPVFVGKNLLTDEGYINSFAEDAGWKVNDNRHISPSSLQGNAQKQVNTQKVELPLGASAEVSNLINMLSE